MAPAAWARPPSPSAPRLRPHHRLRRRRPGPHQRRQLQLLPRKNQPCLNAGRTAARLAASAAAATPAPASAPGSPAPPKGKTRKLTWKEERELETMAATILTAEENLTVLESQLNDAVSTSTAPTKSAKPPPPWKPSANHRAALRPLGTAQRHQSNRLKPQRTLAKPTARWQNCKEFGFCGR